MYKVIALCGEAGCGKDTLAKRVEKELGWNFIISCTTRPIREGEQEGVNYYYLTNEEFANKVLNGDMLETTFFNGWAYGASIDALKENKINIGVFNPDGIQILEEDNRIDLKVIYLQVSPKERLIRQLTRETNPNIDEIFRRYQTDNSDFSEFFHSNIFNLSDDYYIFSNETKEQLEENVKLIRKLFDN